ncbi:MAG: hypothetical protein HY236_04695 [Acidobacteria bacterium]|nr:hypothetical protein [Acidobacteriota bacterium]
MGTTQTPKCLWIENVVKQEIAPAVEVECRKDFDTKDYILWLTIGSKSTRVRFTTEAYEDDRWRPVVQGALEDLNSS